MGEQAQIRWLKDGEARVLRVSGDAIALRSTVPSPPGSRIDGEVVGGAKVRVKIHASKRQEDGSFLLEGRLLDATRELRERLTGLAGECKPS